MNTKNISKTRLRKNAILMILILLSTPGIILRCTPITTNKDNTTANEKLLMERVKTFNNAFQEGDMEKLGSMITENYQHTNGNSKAIGKTAWLGWLQKRKEAIENGDLIVDQYEMKDIKIAWHGATAILTAKIETSTLVSGVFRKNAYRVTNVWVKEEETWKRAGFHDGKIK